MTKNQNKIKVLFVITKSNFGGAQKYVYDLATGLPNDQFEAVVLLGGAGILADKLREANIRTTDLPSLARDVNPLKDLASFFALWKLFRAERPDVVHLNSAKASGLGALAARFAGVPRIIFTAHGWAFNEDRSTISRITIKFFSWLTATLAHRTIAVSEAVRHDTRNWPSVKGKVITIYNGVDSVELLPREEARQKLLVSQGQTFGSGALRSDLGNPDTFIVGTIAELHRNKGLNYAIHTFSLHAQKNRSLYYFILGEGEERGRLEAMIENLGLQNRVFLLGFVENAARYLKAFDVFLLPSVKEGLPYVLLEAGLAELPVIATAVGGIPEIIRDDKTGRLIHPRDSEVLAEAIKQLLPNTSARAAFGHELKKSVLRDFTKHYMLAKTISLYTQK